MTVADAVAADLAYELAVERERTASLETDLGVIREILVTALDGLHQLTRTNKRLTDTNAQLLEELRACREERLLHLGADDLEPELEPVP
jgi:hypothetical protein